jgi:hypothetical protein
MLALPFPRLRSILPVYLTPPSTRLEPLHFLITTLLRVSLSFSSLLPQLNPYSLLLPNWLGLAADIHFLERTYSILV